MDKAKSKRSEDTRLALLRAAELLFAARGVDAVSMREIAAAAAQGNHSAVLYHFHDKRDLLDALLQRHSAPVEQYWAAEVSALAARGSDSLPALVRLMVHSLLALVDDDDGGPEYLQVVAQLVSSRTFPLPSLPATSAPGILALSAAMMRHIPDIPPPLLPLRMLRVAAILYSSISNWHAMGADEALPRDRFEEDLVASLVAVLLAGDLVS